MNVTVQLKLVMDYLSPGVAGLIRRIFEAEFPLLRVVPEADLEIGLSDAVKDNWVEGVREALRLGAKKLRPAIREALFYGHTRCAEAIRLHSVYWGVGTRIDMVCCAAAGGSVAATSLALSWSRDEMCDLALDMAAARGHISLMRKLRGRGHCVLTRNAAFVTAASNGMVSSLVELSSWPAPDKFALRMAEQKGREFTLFAASSLPAIAFESWVADDVKKSPAAPPEPRGEGEDESEDESVSESDNRPVVQHPKTAMYNRKKRYHQILDAVDAYRPHLSALRGAVAGHHLEAATWLWNAQNVPERADEDDLADAAGDGYVEREDATEDKIRATDAWMIAHVPGFVPSPRG